MLFNIFSTGNHKESSLLIKDALLLLVAWIAFIQTRNWLRWRAFHKWAVQNRCGDTPALPNKLPGGIERLFIFFTNLKGISIWQISLAKAPTNNDDPRSRFPRRRDPRTGPYHGPPHIPHPLALQLQHDHDLGPRKYPSHSRHQVSRFRPRALS